MTLVRKPRLLTKEFMLTKDLMPLVRKTRLLTKDFMLAKDILPLVRKTGMVTTEFMRAKDCGPLAVSLVRELRPLPPVTKDFMLTLEKPAPRKMTLLTAMASKSCSPSGPWIHERMAPRARCRPWNRPRPG